jgi:hypothetical protein
MLNNILQSAFNNTYVPSLNIDAWIIPFLEFFFLMILLLIMVYLYRKMRVWLLILTVFLFSLVFGMISIMSFAIPFSPYIQIFFMLFQSIVFFQTSLEVFNQ